ncbi:metallophosphoesterase family protein [Plastoroseomonas arctica]|uniref:Metallophosphoesterase n=1 Tax=Plastoroseomonas arctica TaxID=1509237 RepID=A0AAF1KUG2_9PROT|nr:metallophosphoesterase [Plastoroseomonas arctica]MBR0656127.1 metallophosphoesterase [Plastoroseomonas arctica]
MFTLAQISDTHLGAHTPLFRANFARVAGQMVARVPDVIVATGDVSLDGADREADLEYAARSFARLPRPVLAVPGNHDVGDHPDRAPRQPFSTERLERFERHFGPARWMADREGWRLLGLNSQVAGTGHPEEAAQAGFIAEALATLGERRLAVFLHKPIFTTTPEDPLFDYWSVPPFARAPFLPLLAHPALRLVASGHLHLHHEATRGGVRLAWAPAVSFVVAEDEQPGLPGARPCGYLLHRFGADAVTTELVCPDGMEQPFIHDVRAEAYPDSALLAAAPDAG